MSYGGRVHRRSRGFFENNAKDEMKQTMDSIDEDPGRIPEARSM